MALIFVDVEGGGPAPGPLHDPKNFEFGAVEYKTRQTFHGTKPAAATKTTFMAFDQWLANVSPDARPVFVSDNPAYDWQFINYYFHLHLGRNPMGHSARRIGDFAAGLQADFYARQVWKEWRVTKHDHHPVHDAMGNVEAFVKLLVLAAHQRTVLTQARLVLP